MSRAHRKPALAAGLALWLCALPALADDSSASTSRALSYTEFQQRSDAPSRGRLLSAGLGSRAIDADSSLKIDIDRQILADALLPRSQDDAAQLVKLRERIKQLTPVAQGVRELTVKSNLAARAFQSPNYTFEQYAEALRAAEGAALDTFTELKEAVELRRLDENASPTEAREEAEQIRTSLVPMGQPYDYEGLARQIDFELTALNRSVEALLMANAGRLGVEVRAHLVKQDGSVVTLALPNYNDEAIGPSVRFRRIQTALTQQEREAFKDYEKLAEEINQAKSAGEALRLTLERSFPKLSSEVRQTLNDLLAELQRVRQSLVALANALQPASTGPVLPRLPPELQEPFKDLVSDLSRLEQDLVELEQLRGQFVDRLPAMTPLEAHDAVVQLLQAGGGVLSPRKWAERQARVERFFAALEKHKASVPEALLTSGPIKAALDAKEALERFVTKVRAAATRVQELFKFSGVGQVVEQWPEPVNQQRRSGTVELDTVVDLTTIRGGREEEETLVVRSRFFVDEKLTDEREDRFIIRAFGWRGEAFAGLAFHANHRNGLSTWKPSAAIGWYVTYRDWPDSGQDTGGSSIDYVGVGLSVLSLDFDDEKEIELGVAGGLSLFNNFAQVGYGANISVDEDRGFFFFSIRPLQLGQLLGATGFQ